MNSERAAHGRDGDQAKTIACDGSGLTRRKPKPIEIIDPASAQGRHKVDFPGWVYFISDGGDAIKIGYSGAPELRLRSLQSSHSKTLTLIGSFPGDEEDEKSLHKQFAKLRLRGEWFQTTEELRRFIEEACKIPPIYAEIAGVRRKLKAWAEGKSPTVKLYCNSLDGLLLYFVQQPHLPNLLGSAALALQALEGTIAHERRRSSYHQ